MVLVGPSGSLRFTPSTVRSVTGAWRRHRVPLSADSEWTRTVDGTFSLADVVAIEIHQDTWDAGFTVNYDDVRFTSALPGDLTEGNALRWEPYAEDGAAVSVADEAARVKVGSRALLFTTGSGFSTGVRYPLGGEPHWDLSGVESLSFWTWATNSTTFQGPQPVVYLHSPDGSYRYEPTDTLMTVDGWRYHEVPLAGDEVWARTQGDEPSLSDVIAVEILHDTWDYGFTVVYDGVSFGRPLPELVLDAPSAEGGSPVTGTVRLGTPAPAGGRVVSLSSSDPTVASVPSTVTVPEGALSAPFTVTTAPVSYDRYVWVSFDDAGVSRASSLQVTPPLGVSALSLSPSTVVPGGSATGTVTLTRAAPAGGLTVALSATPAGAVTLLPSVAVPAGETWATFQVQVDAAAATSPVTITASYGTTTRTASLGLYQVSVLTVTPSSAAAPSGGLAVALSTTNGAVTIPATVTAASGSSMATFSVATSTVASPVTGTITASIGPSSKSTTVEVVPLGIKSLGISPPLVGGVAKNGWVELTGPAGTGGVVVTLTSSDPAVLSFPASVTVPQDQTYTTVPATPAVVAADTPVTMTAAALGDQKSASVTVVPFGVQAVTLGSTTIAAGHTTTVRVDLNAAAPTGGLTVTLAATGGGFQRTGQAGTYFESPSTLAFSAGQTTKTDTVLARWRGTPGTLDVTATTPATSRSASATVSAGTIGLGLTSPVRRGGSTTGTISISGWPWPPAGSSIVVGLSSSSASFPVPATATATERTGSLSYSSRWDFALPVGASVPDGTYTITATYEGVSASAPLVVSPSGLTALTVNPSAAPQGALVTGAVFLDAPAPAGGLSVALSSTNGAAASVPGSVLVEPGSSSADFDLTPAAVAATTDVTLSATLDAATRTAAFRALKPGAGSFFGGVVDASVYDVLPPLADVVVGLSDGTSQSATGPDGGFLFYSDPGTVDVTAARSGWVTASLPQQNVAADQAVDLGTLPLRKVLSGSCQFTGRVVTPDNTPVEGATGVLEGYDATVTTAADGRYQFKGPNQGPFRFTFSKSGFPTRTEDVFTFLSYCGLPAQQAELYDFVLDPNPRPTLAGVVVRTPVVIEGGSARLEPILTDPAPAGGASILISPVAPYPTSEPRLRATVPAGWRQGYSFEIPQPAVASSTRKTYALHYGGVTKYVSFDLLAEALHVTCSPPYDAIGGQPLTCTITLLAGTAPAEGLLVSLSSLRGLLLPPPTATIPSGQTAVTVTVGTLAVGVVDEDYLVAVAPVGAGSARVVLHPLGVASLTLSSSTIPGGSSVTGTVVLQAPAPAGGTSVGLGRSNAAVLIPSSVTVPEGQTSATFTLGTTTVASVTAVDLTAYLANPNARRAYASCQVTPDVFVPAGLAPATFLPGDTTPVLYGRGFDAATSTRLYGPYTQYVDPGTGQTVTTCPDPCPSRPLSASLIASGAGVSFAVPTDVTPGVYDVRAEKAGVVSPALWALVESPASTLPAVAEDERDLARPLLPGQTVTSTFPLRAAPVLGALSDYHFYWFFGTAGSRVDLSLARVDTSREWSHPEGLDPRLEVIAPDGFVYENLASEDVAPGANFDAAVVDAQLPLTGLYVVAAETSRGNGDYRLRLSVRSAAPTPPADRLAYLTNVSPSLPVGTRFDLSTLATDPRGYPLGGASVRLVAAPQPGDRGAFQFVGSDTAVLDVRGAATVPVRVTAAGKVSLEPEFVDPTFATLAARPDAAGREGAGEAGSLVLDRFQPVTRWPVRLAL
ncbi:MAG: hypothetical protein DYH06_14165, partial [Acidobacteria bacterium ACB2]|nr:hypothetical protein [Acidobacteria bacterium ACB2]